MGTKAAHKALSIMAAAFFLMLSTPLLPAHAAGDGNADAGGGFSDGEFVPGHTQWRGGQGYEGVRVTIMDISSGRKAAASVDFSNGADGLRDSVEVHFGKVDKRDRHLGSSLSMFLGNYSVYAPSAPLPRIIGASGSIDAVKDYFCDEITLRNLCSHLSFSYESLVDGGYMVLFEPIMYFHYDGLLYAATATERAMLGGGWMPTTTRERLPLSSFLEHDEPDFGFLAWAGPSSGVRTIEEMFAYLGMGMIRFRGGPPAPPGPPGPAADFLYLADTYVYTYIDVTNNNSYGFPHSPYKFGEGEQHGDSPLTVTFHTPSGSHSYDLSIGANSEGRAFVRWKTPAYPIPAGTMDISLSQSSGIAFSKPTYMVIEPQAGSPPDPEARDRHDGFARPHYAQEYNMATASWLVNELAGWLPDMQLKYLGAFPADAAPAYRASGVDWGIVRGSQASAATPPVYADEDIGYWDSSATPWVFVVTGTRSVRISDGSPATYHYYANIDRGRWIHRRISGSASISGTLSISADEKVPTAADGGKRLRSGYGFNALAAFSTNNPAYCTNVQDVQVFFPEFNYEDGFSRARYPLDGRYWRWLERMPEGSGRFEFPVNPWSTYGQRVHFTPVWYPDGAYTIRADGVSAWTPGGELKLTLSDAITIDGSVFDDWHVAPGW
ncbi:MAG: hypothetical protein FWG91_03810 [Lachnospiraceae bacterium]|nr:hypothetical protein [Lachnospiraceae bacterium]